MRCSPEKEIKQLAELRQYLKRYPEAKAEGYLKTTGDMFAKIVRLECGQSYADLDLDCNSAFDRSLRRHSHKPTNIEYSESLTQNINNNSHSKQKEGDLAMANIELNKVNKETGEVTGTMNLEVRAYPIAEPKGNTKGFASVTIDDMFGVHGISIIEGKNGLFAAMPQTKDAKGEFRDIFHPVTSEGRKALNEAILTEFGVALDSMVEKKESALDKIRESAKATKEKATPAAGKEAKEKTNKKVAAEH